MKCTSCGSENLQLIRVFAGNNMMMGWSPVSGEKDILGNYKKLRPLLAHGCGDCGNVTWNIRIEKPQDPDKTAAALEELEVSASEEPTDEEADSDEADPDGQDAAYSLEQELG